MQKAALGQSEESEGSEETDEVEGPEEDGGSEGDGMGGCSL
jgi:hypothetical protein